MYRSSTGHLVTVGWSVVDCVVFGTKGPIGNIDQIPYWVYNGPYSNSRAILAGYLEMWRAIMDEDGQATNEIDPNGFSGSVVMFKSVSTPGNTMIYDLSIDTDGINRVNSLIVDVSDEDVREYDVLNPLGLCGNKNVELTFRPGYNGVYRI